VFVAVKSFFFLLLFGKTFNLKSTGRAAPLFHRRDDYDRLIKEIAGTRPKT
jgi:hypothetical protein